jgi:hypothetical protein
VIQAIADLVPGAKDAIGRELDAFGVTVLLVI